MAIMPGYNTIIIGNISRNPITLRIIKQLSLKNKNNINSIVFYVLIIINAWLNILISTA